jgi:hypothetical protein
MTAKASRAVTPSVRKESRAGPVPAPRLLPLRERRRRVVIGVSLDRGTGSAATKLVRRLLLR